MNANAISVSTQSAHSSIFCELKNLGIIRENLYDLSEELQISKTSFYPIACAIYSGRIAKVLIWQSHKTKYGYLVKIYSGSGQLISGYYWRTSLILLSFNWIHNDTLLFVFENGFVFSYGCGRNHVPRKILQLSNSSMNVVTFYNKGFVASTGSDSLLKVSCEDNTVKFVKMDLNIQENVKCLAIKECFSGSENEDLYISTETGVSYYRHVTCMAQIHRKFIQSIRLSHVQNFLAVYHKNGVLSVFDDTLRKILYEVNLNISDPPLQIAWVASTAVVLTWSEKTILVGKECNIFKMHGGISVFQDCDGMRMISNCYHDFLRPLQGSCNLHFYAEEARTTEVFVYDILRALPVQNNEPFIAKKNENLVSINDYFAMAQFVFDRNEQKKYLENAVLVSTLLCQTKLFYVKNAVVKCCSLLRKLNHLRDASIGMPFTAVQYKLICKQLLLRRLLIFGHHALAMRMFENDSLKRSQILLDWIFLPTSNEEVHLEQLFHLSNKFPDILLYNFIKHATIANRQKYQIVQTDHKALLKVEMSPYEYMCETMRTALYCKDIDAQYLTMFKLISNNSGSGLEYYLKQNSYFNILYYRYNVRSLLIPSLKQKFRDNTNKAEFHGYFAMLFKASISQSATNENEIDNGFLNSLKDQSFGILQNYVEIFEDSIISAQTLSLRKLLFLLVILGRVNLVTKFCDKYIFSERHFTFLKVKSVCKTKSWDSLYDVNVKSINIHSFIALLKKYKAPEDKISFYEAQTKTENTSKLLEGTLLEAQKAASVLSESRQNLAIKATEYIRALNYYT